MSENHSHLGDSDSRDCVNVVIDEPGDRTRRPITDPKRLAILRAEREKIERYIAMMKERQEKNENPPNQQN